MEQFIKTEELKKSMKVIFDRLHGHEVDKFIVTRHGKPIACIVRSDEVNLKGYHDNDPPVNEILAWYVDPHDPLKSCWRAAARNLLLPDDIIRWVDTGKVAQFTYWRADTLRPSSQPPRSNFLYRKENQSPRVTCKVKWCRSKLGIDNESIDSIITSCLEAEWVPEVAGGKFFGAVCPKHEGEY